MSPLTEMTPAPDTSRGGLTDAITGSLLLVGVATLVDTPLGILAGIYLAKYDKTSTLAGATRFINDIPLSTPSIVIGLLVHAVMVARVQHFSGIAGVVAPAPLQIPIVARTTRNTLNLMPNAMREAIMAFGTPKWKMIPSITLRASYTGVITGVLLAVTRIAGETAPLFFIALNSQFWSLDLNQPVTTLPTVIFEFTMGPFPEWQQLAWARVLLITLDVLGLNVLARALFTKK